MTSVEGAVAAVSDPLIVEAKGFVVSNFASQHLKSATFCRDHVMQLEATHHGEPFGAFFEEIRSYASMCILAAAAALEGLANEIFVAHDSPVRIAYGTAFDREFWGPNGDGVNGIAWMKTLEKYNLALTKLGVVPGLEKGDRAYQEARLLIPLRNEFVHFKPDWDNRGRNLEKKLRGKFKLSPFVAGAGDDFITMRCMSGDCARWSVEVVRRFVREFALRAQPAIDSQLKQKLDHFVAS